MPIPIANIAMLKAAMAAMAPTDGLAMLNPGRIGETRLGRYLTAPPAAFEPNSTDVSYKNVQQGAATSVLLAGSPLVKGVSGKYFEDCVPAVPHVPGVRRGVASYALDPEHAVRLWQMSLELIRQGTHRANAGG